MTDFWSFSSRTTTAFYSKLPHKYWIYFQAHHKASVHASDVPHVLFDYHQECRGGHTKSLAKLKAKVEKYMQSFSVFFAKDDEVIR
jgi:hypothetical protein